MISSLAYLTPDIQSSTELFAKSPKVTPPPQKKKEKKNNNLTLQFEILLRKRSYLLRKEIAQRVRYILSMKYLVENKPFRRKIQKEKLKRQIFNKNIMYFLYLF